MTKRKVFGMVQPGSAIKGGDQWPSVTLEGTLVWVYSRWTGEPACCGVYRRLIPAPKINVPSERKT